MGTQIQSGAETGVAPLEYAAPATGRPARLDGMALATHLAGWFLVIVLFLAVAVFVVPRFEGMFQDFRVGLPALTKELLWLARGAREGSFLVLLISVALAHSFAAAWWYRRATRPQLLAYRLVLFLVLAGSVLFVLAGLHLPLFSLMSAMSGGPPPATPAGPGAAN